MRKKMQEGWRQARRQIRNRLDDYSLRKKLVLLYICCVIMPLVLTDSVIACIVVNADRKAEQHEMSNIAAAISYNLSSKVESAIQLTQNIYHNKYINEFMETDFESSLDYFNRYRNFLRDSLYEASVGTSNFQIVMYADNPGIVNGGSFHRLETVRNTRWYQDFTESGRDIFVYPYFGGSKTDDWGEERKISILKKMDYYHKGSGPNLVKLDMDYSGLSQSIVNARYSDVVYICQGDTILFSNDGHGGLNKEYEQLTEAVRRNTGLKQRLNVYGSEWDVYVMRSHINAAQIIMRNLPLLLLLVFVNLLLPMLFMWGINRSFTVRLMELGEAFEKTDKEELEQLPAARGNDEIGVLMRSYNRMAGRINELIQTVYKDRLKEQEINIARQQAELLALHSQINPHFLFNALESIRMHSLLRQELETAHMVEQLALMERQNVEWGNDSVCIKDELRFVEAYLKLQKYRFGERLNYEIEVEPICEQLKVPKLTLVTFVENACVHGLESKAAPGWIFVRGYCSDRQLCLEVEDTGSGMEPDFVRDLLEKMNNVSLDRLKENGRVGILNACLRLKMVTGGAVTYELDSEEGSGTIITIRIPVIKQGEI